MTKLYHDSNGNYSKVEVREGGKVDRYCCSQDKERAEAEEIIIGIYDSIQDLEKYGWKPVEEDMTKLYKDADKYYAKVRIKDELVERYFSNKDKEKAEAETEVAETYDSIRDLEGQGWKPVEEDTKRFSELLRKAIRMQELQEKEPKTLENMRGGELIKENNGWCLRILAYLGGSGNLATYAISCRGRSVDSGNLEIGGAIWTAYQLKKQGYTIVDEKPTTKPLKVTVKQVSDKFGQEVEIIEG
jgi:hypothetical protein